MVSAALGDALYPHPQWRSLVQLWESFYPPRKIPAAVGSQLASLRRTLPRLVDLLLAHRPAAMQRRSLAEVMATGERQPRALRNAFREWQATPARMATAPPSLVFAVIGQARADGRISPEEEGRVLASMLRHWALRSTLSSAASCASRHEPIYAVN
jgi:hypothetical protein